MSAITIYPIQPSSVGINVINRPSIVVKLATIGPKGDKGESGNSVDLESITSEINSLIENQGILADLQTSSKDTLVGALNELKNAMSGVGAGELIDDALSSSAENTYSIDKINLKISSAISSLVDDAPEALNTLNELAQAIASDQSGLSALLASVGNRIRFDDQQLLTSAQQVQACQNIGIGDISIDFVAAYINAKA